MWIEIDLDCFQVREKGFVEKKCDEHVLYLSPGLEKLNSARELVDSEKGIAIEINTRHRHITFGRDYLGQYPLLFMHVDNKLFLTDDILHIDNWVEKKGIVLTLSEESMALYFSLGYVPQGMTLFNEITSCKNVTIYHYKNNKIIEENVFTPIEEIDGYHIREVEERIFEEVSKIINNHKCFDVWCSGGIDSSIMAYYFSRDKRSTEILTLGYDEETKIEFGDGEIEYATEMAQHCQSPLRYAQLSPDRFLRFHKQLAGGHISPVIDTCVIAKYALAHATRNIAITGEGGDPVFGGVKNTTVLFTHAQHPELSLGWIYAHAHCRFFSWLDKIFVHGKELSDYVVEYLNKKIEFYPGDLIRKLFYLNTIEKQGGMIFPQSYYPEKRHGISVYHPLTHLSVYQSAFRLQDNKRYIYPDGKLVLTKLFGNKIPTNIINRKKSGTIIPLKKFMNNMPANYVDVVNLRSTGCFNDGIINQVNAFDDATLPFFIYGFVTLNQWVLQRKGMSHV